ncbi:hypothetical protein M3Y99_00157800 [Aphelenchoides fujianensis]|nr:hypothetical protein M3Y99_00157800 [Aphelenchoides fujianensis]
MCPKKKADPTKQQVESYAVTKAQSCDWSHTYVNGTSNNLYTTIGGYIPVNQALDESDVRAVVEFRKSLLFPARSLGGSSAWVKASQLADGVVTCRIQASECLACKLNCFPREFFSEGSIAPMDFEQVEGGEKDAPIVVVDAA